MKSRYHMKTVDGTKFVEMPRSVIGLDFLKGLRKGRSDLFKGSRIKEVIQAHPSKVRIGELHEYT